MSVRPTHARFAEVTARDDDEVDLAEAALLIAEHAFPGLDVARYLTELERLAEGVRARAPSDAPDTRLGALLGYLFGELGFHGNDARYYDPRNSFLNVVLEDRRGIPITLSVVVLEVGRRVGLDLAGIAFPGHFLVRARLPAGDVILDPFHGGLPLQTSDLVELLRRVLGRDEPLRPEHMPLASKRQILTRMLNNLRGIYQRDGDWIDELAVVELLAVLHPDDRPLADALVELRRRADAVN